MMGLLSFSLATGLLFGRFSKPNLKLVFSENALISDYPKNNGKGLMFKLANKRNGVLLETKIQVIATYNIKEENQIKRAYSRLDLELSEVKMLPSQWTVVHPINEESLFRKFTIQQMIEKDLELLVLVKSVEETYAPKIVITFFILFEFKISPTLKAFQNTPRFLSCFWSLLLVVSITKYILRTIQIILWRFSCLSFSVWLFFHKLSHNG